MNPLAFVSLLLAITCYALAVFIIKISNKKLHRLWALFNIAVGVWGTGIFLASISSTSERAFRCWQFAHLGGCFVAVFFFHVIANFCELNKKAFLIFLYTLAISFSILNLFGLAGYKVFYAFDSLYYIKADNFVYVIFQCLFGFCR